MVQNLQRISTGPSAWEWLHFRVHVKEKLSRSARPLPDGLGVRNDAANGVQGVGTELFFPVVVVVELQFDSSFLVKMI